VYIYGSNVSCWIFYLSNPWSLFCCCCYCSFSASIGIPFKSINTQIIQWIFKVQSYKPFAISSMFCYLYFLDAHLAANTITVIIIFLAYTTQYLWIILHLRSFRSRIEFLEIELLCHKIIPSFLLWRLLIHILHLFRWILVVVFSIFRVILCMLSCFFNLIM